MCAGLSGTVLGGLWGRPGEAGWGREGSGTAVQLEPRPRVQATLGLDGPAEMLQIEAEDQAFVSLSAVRIGSRLPQGGGTTLGWAASFHGEQPWGRDSDASCQAPTVPAVGRKECLGPTGGFGAGITASGYPRVAEG